MSNFCIVSEFNPLHNGHKYLLDKARELGADAVICIMSGNATQRGELACVDKYLRARAALESGADLVLELPYPWSAASADYFASASTYIASHFGDTVFFGSECGDIEKLWRAAEICETREFSEGFQQKLDNGMGAAAAYLDCLAEGGFESFSSNDLLGISYLRAIKRNSLTLRAVTTQRLGAAYNEKNELDGVFQSASALRNLAEAGELDKVRAHVPKIMWEIMLDQSNAGRLTNMSELDTAIMCYFRLGGSFDNIAEAGGGIANRICAAARESTSSAEMFEKLRTKRYTDAKLRRAMLYCMTGVEKSHLDSKPEYTLLLAANGKGRELLAKNKKAGGIRVVTKPADAPMESEQYRLGAALESLFSIARKTKDTSYEFLKKNAFIEINEKT